jgi:hypothetical protein
MTLRRHNNYPKLKYTFTKASFSAFGRVKDMEYRCKEIFGCESGSLPFKYLGVPIHHIKFRNSEWNSVGSCFVAKLGCWQSKLPLYGDRLVLINSVLTRLPMFMLSFLKIPIGVVGLFLVKIFV